MCGREMTWQVRRLISAPVVEPESVAETVASSHSPSGLHRGIQDPQAIVGQRPAVRAVQAADIHRPALAEGKIGDGHILAIRREGLDVLVREHLTFTAGKVETVNDVLVLPAWRSVRSRRRAASPPAIPAHPPWVIWRRFEPSRLTMKRSKMPMPRLKTICAPSGDQTGLKSPRAVPGSGSLHPWSGLGSGCRHR